MKKVLAVAVGVMMIGTCGWAQTNVLSQNAVGYVKLTVPADPVGSEASLLLARYDFVAIDGSPTTVEDVLGDQPAKNTVVWIWDRTAGEYILPAPSLTEFLGTKTWNNGNEVIQPGDAFWIQNGDGEPATDIFLLGEVPGANNASETTDVVDATTFVGYPYPAAVDFDTTAIADVAGVGAVLFRWDPDTQGYVVPGPQKGEFLGSTFWDPAGTMIQPGEGFYVSLVGAKQTAQEVKPYLWP